MNISSPKDFTSLFGAFRPLPDARFTHSIKSVQTDRCPVDGSRLTEYDIFTQRRLWSLCPLGKVEIVKHLCLALTLIAVLQIEAVYAQAQVRLGVEIPDLKISESGSMEFILSQVSGSNPVMPLPSELGKMIPS